MSVASLVYSKRAHPIIATKQIKHKWVTDKRKVQQILLCNEYTFIVQACISVDFGLFDAYHHSSCRYFPCVFSFWPKIRISYNFSLISAQLSVTCRMESVEKTQSYSNLLKDGISPAEYFSQLSPLHKHSSKIFLGAGYHQMYM